MFGDIGHGALLFIFGMYLVLFKNSILADKSSALKGFIPARYLVALMGFFALYAGLIYNDFLSLNLNLFGSCYTIVPNALTAIPKDSCVYPFGKLIMINLNADVNSFVFLSGIDPIWGRSSNGLTNANSFKMKLAVIFAVT